MQTTTLPPPCRPLWMCTKKAQIQRQRELYRGKRGEHGGTCTVMHLKGPLAPTGTCPKLLCKRAERSGGQSMLGAARSTDGWWAQMMMWMCEKKRTRKTRGPEGVCGSPFLFFLFLSQSPWRHPFSPRPAASPWVFTLKLSTPYHRIPSKRPSSAATMLCCNAT